MKGIDEFLEDFIGGVGFDQAKIDVIRNYGEARKRAGDQASYEWAMAYYHDWITSMCGANAGAGVTPYRSMNPPEGQLSLSIQSFYQNDVMLNGGPHRCYLVGFKPKGVISRLEHRLWKGKYGSKDLRELIGSGNLMQIRTMAAETIEERDKEANVVLPAVNVSISDKSFMAHYARRLQ